MFCRSIVVVIFFKMNVLSQIQDCCGFMVEAVRGGEGATRTLLAVEGEELKICCPDLLSPCTFTHPNGTELPSSGDGSSNEVCHVRLKVHRQDSGNWTCRRKSDVARVQHLKVVEAMAVVEENITTETGREVTLLCTAAKTMLPLSFCRFVSPEGTLFEDTSESKSSEGYTFSPGGLQRGACALTIRRAEPRDRGAWRCAVGLQGSFRAYGAVIHMHIEDSHEFSLASTAAIAFSGTLVVAGAGAAGGVAWRRRRLRGAALRRQPSRVRCESEPAAATSARDVPLIVVHMTRSHSAGLIEELCLM